MQPRKRIAVAGATGRVGHHVVGVLMEHGHDVVPIARATGVDVITGENLQVALEGVDAIVDAASWHTPDEQAATSFFTTAAANLQSTGARAGVRRIVVVSIIGTDRFKSGYGVAKVAHERAMLAGPIPVQILRAAQFHEFVGQMVEWGSRGEVSYVPKMRTQLVAARTVAEALAALATGPRTTASSPESEFPEIAGPRAENLVEIAKLFASRRGAPMRIEGVSDPADPNRDLYESGALLPGPHATLAGPTYEQWLESDSRVRRLAHAGRT